MHLLLKFFKKIFPNSLKRRLNIITGRINSYKGSYSSWDEAVADSCGYSSDLLLKRIIASNQAVIDKKSCYERDGVLFDEINYALELNACILMAYALKESNNLFQIVDYGGSLGTSYRQFESFTREKLDFRWNILEQEELYKYGAEKLNQDKLRFYSSSSNRIDEFEPEVIIFSAVLEFLENYSEIISQAVASRPKWIVMDRVPVWSGSYNHLCVLKAAKHITGSYPCWIFQEEFINSQMVGYELVSRWTGLGGGFVFAKGCAEYIGMLWRRT